jgi:hypothetical protein
MKIDHNYLIDAGCLFEKQRGVSDEYIEHVLSVSPLTDLPIDEISKAISVYVEEAIYSPNELLTTAIFALGKSYNEDHSELYLKIMKLVQSSNPKACYQAAIAFENLGNRVFFGTADGNDESAFLKSINKYLVANAL